MQGNEYKISGCINAKGLSKSDSDTLKKLIDVFQNKLSNNKERLRYYQDKVKVKNLGIAVPQKFERQLKTDVGWAAKAVDMLAERSVFDGFVIGGQDEDTDLDAIMRANEFSMTYEMALTSELIYSCGFWTVTKGDKYPIIRYYNAENGAALWDWDKRRIKAGFVITDYQYVTPNNYNPVCIVLHTDTAMITLKYSEGAWYAEKFNHIIGRPLMEAMSYKPSSDRPFGKSVISRPCMSIIDEMKRELLRTSLHSELYTSPAKYVLGAAHLDEETANTVKRIFSNNEIFVADRDENGDTPEIGQLAASSMQPHNEAMQTLAKRMAAEASIPLNSLGIIHDNPSSAEALRASMEDLTVKAEKLNRTNGKALRNLARLAIAVHTITPYAKVSEEVPEIDVCWKNPSQPTMSSVADAMMKQASVLPWLAETDVFLECLGYNDSQRARLNRDKRRIQAEQRIAQTTTPIPTDEQSEEIENGATDTVAAGVVSQESERSSE